MEKGALQLSKKEMARLEQENQDTKKTGLQPEGRAEEDLIQHSPERTVEIPKEGMMQIFGAAKAGFQQQNAMDLTQASSCFDTIGDVKDTL
ncbi:hypothetical protein LTR28_004681 [Elasticomyces elasticus]|nr:hypothetical protein LTR28_004681 [Elasticomyces elasticus]